VGPLAWGVMIDVTDATFQTEVIERSSQTPVVVDLWAPWCGPCKTLGPLIEKVVDETNGRVVLAKVNVDENPQVSAAFQVQSIPAVYALVNGQVVDGFMGAQPEDKLREFTNKLIAGELAAELEALVGIGNEESLRKAIEVDPTYKPAVVALARILLVDRASEVLELLEAVESDDEIEQLADEARQAVLPDDARTGIEHELTTLLATVKGDDEARQRFVELLEELTAGDPAAAGEWRRKLSTQLY